MFKEECEFLALGTNIQIKIVFEDQEQSKLAKHDIENLKNTFHQVEERFSRFNDSSELSEVNEKIGEFCEVSGDFLEVCKRSLKAYYESQKFFDPRVITVLESIGYDKSFSERGILKNVIPVKRDIFKNDLKTDLIIKNNKVLFRNRMDFSGIVKGWVTDKSREFLVKNGWKNFFISSGGDAVFSGKDEFGEFWTVDLEGFSGRDLVLEMNDLAIATSGIAKRKWEFQGESFYHLINPKNQNVFPKNLNSVTVVSDKTEKADIMAKTLFLMGKEKGLDYSKNNKIMSAFLDSKGNVFISSEIKKIIRKN